MRSARRSVLVLLAAMLAVAGCSSISEEESRPFFGLRDDGIYVLSERERTYDCRRMAAAQAEHVKLMEASRAKVESEREAPPRSLVGIFERLTNSDVEDSDSESQLKLHQAAVAAFAQAMVEKKCDIDNQLRPDGKPARGDEAAGSPLAISAKR